MPRGPKGEKRPADVIGNAVKVMRIATGEESDNLPTDDGKDPAAKALGSRMVVLQWPRRCRSSGGRETKKAAEKRWKNQ